VAGIETQTDIVLCVTERVAREVVGRDRGIFPQVVEDMKKL
jgi:hypothetical protein